MEIATIRTISPTSSPGRVGENPGNEVVITNQLAGFRAEKRNEHA